jgi:diguanylate cyclase (GGDEF)-like protein
MAELDPHRRRAPRRGLGAPAPAADPAARRLLAEGDTQVLIQRYQRHDDGTQIWVEVHSNGIRDRTGEVRLIFVHCLDVTRQQEHEAELKRQVREDSLTGLLSRAAFEQDLAGLLAAGAGPVSVIYLDVDRFKSINDGSGHAVGDDVLRGLAGRLTRLVPEGSLVARLGGDEFVVALPGSAQTGLDGAAVLLASFAQPLPLPLPLPVAGSRLQLSASLGLAVAQDPAGAEDAVLAADTAMYAAKRAGGNRLEVFNEDMRTAVRRRIVAEALLREALDGDRDATLPVWFQPIVSPGTGRIAGAEALVRMRTADDRLLAPGHFIETAEETGVRIALDDFGTGYSSLTWLQSVPADIVKLDRSFVAGLAHDGRKASIVSAVLWLARSLGMSVVAEGVEEVDDWAALREAGCPAIQGYFFSRPVPPEDFANLLRQSAAASVPIA